MEVPLEFLYQKLTLTDQKDDTVQMDGQQFGDMAIQMGRCLVLRLLTNKPYNIKVFWHTMRRVWRLTQPLKFWDLGRKISLTKFTSIQYKNSIIINGLWFFDKHLVLLSEVDGTKLVQQLRFHMAQFWVRLHDLPTYARKEHASRAIRNSFKEVLEIDIDKEQIAWGAYMCVLISIDISKTLF